MAADLIDQLTADPDFLKLPEAARDELYEELSGMRPSPQPEQHPLSKFLDIHPSPLGPSLRETPRVVANAADAALFGLIPNRLKERLPPIESARGHITDVGAQGAALLAGGPGRLAGSTVKGLAKVVPGLMKSFLRRSAVRGVQGGVLGAATDVTDVETLPQRVGLGATLGLVSPSAVESGRVAARVATTTPQRVKEAMTLGRPSTLTQPNRLRDLTFSRIRQRMLQAPKVASKQFESSLDELIQTSPTTVIDATEEVVKAKGFQSNPHFATVMETSLRQAPMTEVQRGIVRNIFTDPQAALNLSLEQAQLVKRVFQQALKQKWKQINPEFLGAHLDMQELWHSLRAKELAAFPGFEKVAKEYATSLQAFRTVATALKEGNIEQAILSNFQNKGLLIEKFRELASPGTLEMIKKLQRATNLRKGLKRVGLVGAGLVAGKVGGAPLARFLGLTGASQ